MIITSRAIRIADSVRTAEKIAQLDDICARLVEWFGVTAAAISFPFGDYVLNKSEIGVGRKVIPKSQSFCPVTLQQCAIYCVENTRSSLEWRSNCFVTGQPFFGFYAGAQIPIPDHPGVLAIADSLPRNLQDDQIYCLRVMARAAGDIILAGC